MKAKATVSTTLGATVLYRVSKDEAFPMIVTKVNKDGSFNGQVFMDGTQVKHVENAVIGDDEGQCAAL